MILEVDEGQARTILAALALAAGQAAREKHLADAADAADMVAEIAGQLGENDRAQKWRESAERMRAAQHQHDDRRATAAPRALVPANQKPADGWAEPRGSI